MIVAKFTVHDCSATDYPATRRSAFASGLALVGGTDMPAHRRGPAEQAMCFGTFHLLPRQRLLVEDGHPVHLGSRALDILVALVERAGHVVEKHELMARVWPDSSVEESKPEGSRRRAPAHPGRRSSRPPLRGGESRNPAQVSPGRASERRGCHAALAA